MYLTALIIGLVIGISVLPWPALIGVFLWMEDSTWVFVELLTKTLAFCLFILAIYLPIRVGVGIEGLSALARLVLAFTAYLVTGWAILMGFWMTSRSEKKQGRP